MKRIVYLLTWLVYGGTGRCIYLLKYLYFKRDSLPFLELCLVLYAQYL